MWDMMFYIQICSGVASNVAGCTGIKITYRNEPNPTIKYFLSVKPCVCLGVGMVCFLMHHYEIIVNCM